MNRASGSLLLFKMEAAAPANPAKLVARTNDMQGDGNHPQGCSFSPDGLCVLTATAGDSKLRLYNTHVDTATTKNDCTDGMNENNVNTDSNNTVVEWKTALTAKGQDAVRSYAWYPHMKSTDPGSCCFLATCRDQPVHLFDAYTGVIRATYCPYNALDEMESPAVVAFSADGSRILTAGFRSDRVIHVFDTAVPGRTSTKLRLGKTRRSSDGQKGLVSAVAFSPDSRIFGVGTYSPGSIYIYDDRSGQQPTATILTGVCVVGHGRTNARKKRHFAAIANTSTDNENDNGDDDDNNNDENWFSAAKVKWFHSRARGGITQLQFAPTEYTLYSASRRSNAVLSWDLRMLSGNPDQQSNPIGGTGSFETDSETNQRMEFDLDDAGERMYVGGRDKCIRIYNVASGKLQQTIAGLDDAANGVSVCNSSASSSRGYLAVATGARRFPTEDDFDNDVKKQTSDQPPGHLHLYRL